MPHTMFQNFKAYSLDHEPGSFYLVEIGEDDIGVPTHTCGLIRQHRAYSYEKGSLAKKSLCASPDLPKQVLTLWFPPCMMLV